MQPNIACKDSVLPVRFIPVLPVRFIPVLPVRFIPVLPVRFIPVLPVRFIPVLPVRFIPSYFCIYERVITQCVDRGLGPLMTCIKCS